MLELYLHPLASSCWKVLLALYENATPFQPHTVDLPARHYPGPVDLASPAVTARR